MPDVKDPMEPTKVAVAGVRPDELIRHGSKVRVKFDSPAKIAPGTSEVVIPFFAGVTAVRLNCTGEPNRSRRALQGASTGWSLAKRERSRLPRGRRSVISTTSRGVTSTLRTGGPASLPPIREGVAEGTAQPQVGEVHGRRIKGNWW